jgi:lipopolysaccharide export LptBFGC system permease protein LptF|uniref:Probable permease YjgP/YjgQ family n=2 Tax=Cyanidioschyzon merolae TaxID=45157 RepID=Q85G79_CYAM1|nr:probable permease YjgP/YjgQ family [Cyanidioschyzon merolae strain 10D]QFV16929.1 putative permease YjgP/YjgQ family [Cyanidioschyzon merolae]QFV17108.1 putative permease YjgP/YjgQ family [Cyanidioschyzon merolae]BAC76111.1 probable permease YjgP/YjgQ family [Cyanidioschyzon merolae strain 10D]
MTIFEQYIWSHLWTPFLYALSACLALTFSAGALVDVMRQITQGLSLDMACQILCLQLVLSIHLGLPASCVFGGIFAYANLDLMALRTSGIGVARWLKPSLIFGCMVGWLAWQWNEWALPLANYSLHKLQDQIQNQITSKALVNQINHKLIYVKEWKPLHMNHCVMWDSEMNQLWMAKQIDWDGARWIAKQVVHYQWDDQFQLQLQSHVAKMEWPTAWISQQQWQPMWMNVQTLKCYKQVAEFNKHIAIRYYQKYAFPISCGLLHLIGSSLASVSKKGFILSLIVLFGYYLFGFGCEALAESSQMSALMAGWMPVAGLFFVLCLCMKQAS